MSGVRARLLQELVARLGAGVVPAAPPNELEMEVRADDLPEALALLEEESARFLTAYVAGEQARPGPRVRYVLELEREDLLVVLAVPLDGERPRLRSLALRYPVLAWAEREMQDLARIEIEDHPDPRPLLAPAATAATAVEGEGVARFARGPLRAYGHESLLLRVAAAGERVVHVEPQLYYKRRGAEALATGLSPAKAATVAERLCGTCSASHATALSLAVERIAGVSAPAKATWLRTALLELERLAAHARTLSEVAAAAGVPHAARGLLEDGDTLAGVLAGATGSRVRRGLIAPGGTRRELSAAAARSLADAGSRLARDAAARIEHELGRGPLAERLDGIGVVAPEVVRELELGGPLARASGSRRDARRDHPYLEYEALTFWVPLQAPGDALARVRVAVDEMQQSAAIAEEMLENLPAGPHRQGIGALPPSARALGIVESPSGPLLHAVHTDGSGVLAAWHARSASQAGWQALPFALLGAALEDLELIERSLGLCAACVDR